MGWMLLGVLFVAWLIYLGTREKEKVVESSSGNEERNASELEIGLNAFAIMKHPACRSLCLLKTPSNLYLYPWFPGPEM